MKLPAISVRRPVFTGMITLAVILLGWISLHRLRLDMLPAVELPRLTVRANYEGASPEVMERLVTQILEEILATVPGVEELSSSSSEGSSDIRVTFGWGTDIDVAAQDVRSRLEDELNELPEGLDRVRLRKFDVSNRPVVLLGVSSDMDPVALTELIDKQIRYRFALLDGVAQVDMWGGFPRELRVELDAERLRALDLPLDSILDSIRNANLDLPAGRIEDGRYEVVLRAPAEFRSIDEIENTIVAVRNGASVTLGQIATVHDTYERQTRLVRINGQTGIRVAIRKQSDANTVEVSRRVLDEIEAVNRDFPQIKVVAVSNQGDFIERSIHNVVSSVLYGGGFAILVLLLFLRHLRSTLVISLAIPISAIATFAMVYGGGLTLNLMTLGGLALGVGMMVDSSIVVLENIYRRHRSEGEDPKQAAVHGAQEVGPAIVASTITTLVIFLPLVFVEGVTGLLFRELAYVIAFSLICALLVALSVVPVLAGRLLGPARGGNGASGGPAARQRTPGRFWLATERAFAALERGYGEILDGALRRRLATFAAAIAALGLSLLLLPRIGTELLPPTDEGEVQVSGEMEQGTRLELVNAQAEFLENAVRRRVPEAKAWVVTARGGTSGSAEANIELSVGSSAGRKRSNSAIAADLRRELEGRVPGMDIRVRAPQGQRILERVLGSAEGLNVEVRGYDVGVLEALARQVEEVMRAIPGVVDTDLSRDEGIPQQQLHVDRAKAADLGLTVRDVARALETAVAGSPAGEFRSHGNSYRILVQLANADRLSIDEVLDLTASGPDGRTVALRNVVDTTAARGPVNIQRKDQQRVLTVNANVAGRPEGSVATDLQRELLKIPRPAGYELRVAGSFEEQERSFGELMLSFGLALALVYMALACQYESLRDPLIVMVSVPFAAIGVISALHGTGTTFNVQSLIGCLMLGGIVVNNAILLVDQANQLRPKLGARAAVLESGRRRLRPILMTTLTTVLGLLPLALGVGEGAEAQAPLARAVIGGLLASTLVTLVLIPVVYTVVHRERGTATERARGQRHGVQPQPAQRPA